MLDYPNAGKQFFAHEVVRLMTRTCAAQEIGADGFMLVTVIAHTEDAKRYTAPVTFWNDQLMSILAFSYDKLNRARAKAIRAGWLSYERGGKGKVGRYWVDKPPQFTGLDDVAVDDDTAFSIRTSTEENTNETICVCTSTERSFGEALEKLGTSSNHSSLSLKPTPKPKRSPKSSRGDSLDSVVIPENLDTPKFRQAWSLWQKHRREIKKPLRPTSATKQLEQFAAWGGDRAVAAIDHTIAKGWQGIREPEGTVGTVPMLSYKLEGEE